LKTATTLEAPRVLSPSFVRTITWGVETDEACSARRETWTGTIAQPSPRIHSKTAGPLGNFQHFLGIKKYIEIRKEIIKRPIIFSDTSPHAGAFNREARGHQRNSRRSNRARTASRAQAGHPY
jgi:hypothetical protein